MPTNRIWITWEKQRRNKGISSAFACELYEITYSNTRIIRYVKSLCMTAYIITKRRPEVVVAQNPSILLAAYVVMLKYIFRYKCIIDAHNAGIFPYDNKIKLFNMISKTIQKYADLTIVTNIELSKVVCSNNGRAVVLPDKLPDPPDVISKYHLCGKNNFAFICSFSSDEPYNEVIEAARCLPDNVHIYVTGKYDGKVDANKVPSNVSLLGFITDEEYWNLISSVDGIIVLTIRENCLVCGAYEAISLKKPMILSNTHAIRKYFTLGSIYSEPNSREIKDAILSFIENKDKLSTDVEILENKLKRDWENNFTDLLEAIKSY